MADSFGDAAKGQTGMENCLQKNGNINVVYAINEPAAAGAYKALKAAGKEKDVVILGVDGMCSNGVGNVEKGVIAATSMQYPLKMAAMGVAAAILDGLAGGLAVPPIHNRPGNPMLRHMHRIQHLIEMPGH